MKARCEKCDLVITIEGDRAKVLKNWITEKLAVCIDGRPANCPAHDGNYYLVPMGDDCAPKAVSR